MSFVFNRPYAITNQVVAYSWGIPGGISARLQRSQVTQPEAEMWIGAHPKAPSRVSDIDLDLCELEKLNGKQLPYLLKLLAVNAPLSIQAHPTKAQAQAGYLAEENAGIAANDPCRNYRDQNAKPELIVALESGFEALCGFRKLRVTAALLQLLAELSSVDPDLNTQIIKFANLLETQKLAATVAWALEANANTTAAKQELYTALVHAAASLPAKAHADTKLVACAQELDICAGVLAQTLQDLAGLITSLHLKYPQDLGIFVAILLQHHKLAPGQSLWLPPGTPHAYLGGYAIEIMGASDNVLRGGLTEKHVDTQQLLATLNFNTQSAGLYVPAQVAGTLRFCPDPEAVYAPCFELVKITQDCIIGSADPQAILVVDGNFTVSAGSGQVDLEQGASAISPAGQVFYQGVGQAYVATGLITSIDDPLKAA